MSIDCISLIHLVGSSFFGLYSMRPPGEPCPNENGKMYIGNLDYGVSVDALRKILIPAGSVLSCEIPLDSKGRSRGYAMVQFELGSMSDSVLKSLNGVEVNGRKILVREDREPKKKNLRVSEDVKVEDSGVSQNGRRTTQPPVSDTNKITFDESKKNKGMRQSIRPKIELDEESAGRLVYLGNIPWSVSVGEINEFVGGTECQIPTDKRGRSKGYALVSFDTVEAARRAISQYNECEWLGRKLISRLFEFKQKPTNNSETQP